MAASTINDALQGRILDAAWRCASRWGVSKTTIDDVAREAGCSRATIYRLFSGKDGLLAAASHRDVAMFFAGLSDRLDRTESLDELVVVAITEASQWVSGHQVFQYLLAHEPEVVLPQITFHGLDRLFDLVADYALPHLTRFVAPADGRAIVEWATRLVVSYTLLPSVHLDLSEEADVRRLVHLRELTHVID